MAWVLEKPDSTNALKMLMAGFGNSVTVVRKDIRQPHCFLASICELGLHLWWVPPALSSPLFCLAQSDLWRKKVH